MFDEKQLVEMKWAHKTRKYYESKGYEFTNYGDVFFVKAKDLQRGASARVKVICDFCGDEIYVSFVNYNRRSNKNVDACNKCKVQKQWDGNKEHRAKEKFDKLKKFCDDKNYTLITRESEYSGARMIIDYICAKHGAQTQSLEAMLNGHGCICCSYEERGLNCRHSIEYVESVINGVNGNVLLNPDEYIDVFTKNLRIKCGECGDEYVTNLDSYVWKNQTRCPHCSKSESVGEFRIRKFLESSHIYFEQEKTFDDCRDKKCLPFDFYLPDYNLIIEFDGQNHYCDIGFGSHEITVAHDKIKNEYCESHNINLLRIPYWEGNNIEQILKDKLCL